MNGVMLDPKILGFWTRCIREASHWSQEAVAESSGLTVRTIQRIEAGKRVNITTRRLLARGLGYDNQDIFDHPDFIKTVHNFLQNIQDSQQDAQKAEIEKNFHDHVRVACARVQNGETLCRLADVSRGLSLHANDNISFEAKQAAASLFDYIRDILDVADDVSFSDKVVFARELEELLRELEALGTSVYSATRRVKIVGPNWVDKTPLVFTIGYVTVVPSPMLLTEMMVSRRIQL